jgi:transcriptional regulator with GAF, ATPase, and Fis domain
MSEERAWIGLEDVLDDVVIEAFLVDKDHRATEFLREIEKGLIVSVLKRVGGNQKEAASILKIKYTTLNMKIKRYGIILQKVVVPSTPAMIKLNP